MYTGMLVLVFLGRVGITYLSKTLLKDVSSADLNIMSVLFLKMFNSLVSAII